MKTSDFSRSVLLLASLWALTLSSLARAETPEDEEASLGDFLLSKAKDAGKAKGEEILSDVGNIALQAGLSYVGLDGLMGGEKDPFGAHAAEILSAIQTAKIEVINHIDNRWDAQTYADASAALKKLNQWRNFSLSQRADQVSVAADLFDAFASVLGRYEADLYLEKRLDLLHEYAAVADITASLAAEWARLTVLSTATQDLRSALAAQRLAQGITTPVTVEDALIAMNSAVRADLDAQLRTATRDSINTTLLGAPARNIPAASNLVQLVASISAEDLMQVVSGWTSPIRVGTSFRRSDGRWQSEWFYDMKEDSTNRTYGVREIQNGGTCSRSSVEYYGQWDGWDTNWSQSWMVPACQGEYVLTLSWGIPPLGHKLATAVHLYTPVRLLLEKWWQLAGNSGLRPYNELDDLTDMYFMDFHAEQGGDTIEAFAYVAADGAPLRIDRSYADSAWRPRAVWDRVFDKDAKRLPSSVRTINRALVDIALRWGPNGVVDFLGAVTEFDGLRSTAPRLDETVRDSRTGMKPKAYQAKQRGLFAAKFASIM